MLTERLQKELEETYAKGLRRTVDGLRFKTAVRAKDENGKEYLVFASNNYLGLTHAPEVQRAAAEAVRWGTGGERAARAAVLQQARRLKPADWRKNWRNLNTPKARWCSIPVT